MARRTGLLRRLDGLQYLQYVAGGHLVSLSGNSRQDRLQGPAMTGLCKVYLYRGLQLASVSAWDAGQRTPDSSQFSGPKLFGVS